MKQSPRQRSLGFADPDASPTSVEEPCEPSQVDAAADGGADLMEQSGDKQSDKSSHVVSKPQEPIGLKGQTVWVVDAHALIYQVFHVMSEMTGPSGQPVGAIHGFTRDMLDLL